MFIESPANLELLGLLLCQALAANSACMMGAFQANAEGCVVAGTSEGEQLPRTASVFLHVLLMSLWRVLMYFEYFHKWWSEAADRETGAFRPHCRTP